MAANDDAPLVVLLWGDDTERIEAAVARARVDVLGASSGLEAFNHESFDAPYTEGFGPVLAACQQLPMMASRRLVELSGPESFGKHVKDAPPADKCVDALLDYVQAPSPTTLLLISSGGLRSTSRLVKAVTKSPHGRAERFKAPGNDREAAAWVHAHARAQGIRMGSGAADELVRRVGYATTSLRSGIERAR
ncbi:MAG: DNA polymerase III subunit delta, partial [Nannocystaceae bacterium]